MYPNKGRTMGISASKVGRTVRYDMPFSPARPVPRIKMHQYRLHLVIRVCPTATPAHSSEALVQIKTISQIPRRLFHGQAVGFRIDAYLGAFSHKGIISRARRLFTAWDSRSAASRSFVIEMCNDDDNRPAAGLPSGKAVRPARYAGDDRP